jgi:hypothetical protein
MKVSFLILMVFLSGCKLEQQSMPANLTPEQIKEKTQKVIKIIESKPDWLFSGADVCPGDVIPVNEKKIKYQSEGCSNNPESCLEKCRAEDGNACYGLALFLQEKNGVEDKNPEPLFLRSCRLGIISGCTNRAAQIFNAANGNAQALKCGADTFEKTCARDDAWGCTMFGTALAFGEGREQSNKEALKFLAKACQHTSSVEGPACKGAREIEAGLSKIEEIETNQPKKH